MNRIILTVYFLICFITGTFGQERIAFYDAVYLRSIMDANHGKFKLSVDTRPVFDYYFGADSKIADRQLSDSIKKNPFLVLYFGGAGVQSNPQGMAPVSGITSVGNLDVTYAVDGIAKLLVKRSRQELSIPFFQRFRDDFKRYPDLKTVFPKTYDSFNNMGGDIYMYSAYIEILREAFKADILCLASNLPGIIANHKSYFDNRPELKAELLTAFYVAQSTQNNLHPGEMIENFDISLLNPVKNVKAAYQTFQLFSSSLKNNDAKNSTYWVPSSEVKKLVNDEAFFKIYLGLLAQKARRDSISFILKDGRVIYLADKMNEGCGKTNYLTPYKVYFTSLAVNAQALDSKITAVRGSEVDSLLFENYYSALSSSFTLMQQAIRIDHLPFLANDSINLEEKTRPFLDQSRKAAYMIVDIYRKNYSSAIMNVSQFIRSIDVDYKYFRSCEESELKSRADIANRQRMEARAVFQYAVLVDSVRRGNNGRDTALLLSLAKKAQLKTGDAKALEIVSTVYNDSAVYLNALQQSNWAKEDQYTAIIKDWKMVKAVKSDSVFTAEARKVQKYGSFMAAVAQAKSPDEVAAALEAASLPAGRASVKRNSSLNVSFNAYLGGFWGNEYMADNSLKKWSGTFGLAAPVGLAISKGFQKFGSVSGFFSIIDIGTLASFRLKDTTSASLPKISLRNIFAPGAGLVYGLPNCPLSIGYMYQWGPALRPITSNAASVNSGNLNRRWFVFVAVDIPIFNLYNRVKN